MVYFLDFNGIVQGIGFRPTAQRLALSLGLRGFVKNSGGSVSVTVCGDKKALDDFVGRLVSIFEIKSYSLKTDPDESGGVSHGFDKFEIVSSVRDGKTPFITPDLATCPDCERELFDSKNRRYLHPFISCVNCGPRYTIIKSLPYDRANTVMSKFQMCSDCKKEYKSPQDRRCHAQTTACNSCGPITNIPIAEAADELKNGGILAIKDIGGYHLACKTDSVTSVLKIRELKGREKKPFAVMFSTLSQIREHCFLGEKEKELLTSPARPIVLLKKKKDFDFSVCGNSDYIGAFLPCNPIQLMLLREVSPLVMTSANISGEPIITDDDEIKKFGVKTLSHNRDILTALDDSVMRVTAGKNQFIRRARGFVPLAVDIGVKSNCNTFCAGGDLKAAFAFHRGKYVFMSQYFGDLENADALNAYKQNISRFADLHSFDKKMIACDLHPGYFSSGVFKPDIKIQHHKAHIASVIAEHRLSGDVLGFAFDGTGYGDDGAVWGSETILFKDGKFTRKEHFDYVKMPMSDEISKNADLALDCYLGTNAFIGSMVKNNINVIDSSSAGRLFDAVCALLDINHYNSYEGECAEALESAASKAKKAYPLKMSANPADILNGIKSALKNGAKKEPLALGFHHAVCEYILCIAQKHRKECGVNQIALSGGVFNNKIITEKTISLLNENGFEVYINELVPCGDGGIALGQAYIAAIN